MKVWFENLTIVIQFPGNGHSEEKIRNVLEGFRGKEMISELCRREGIAPTVYYKWSKAFLEACKQRFVAETKRGATNEEIPGLKRENAELKRLVVEQFLQIEA